MNLIQELTGADYARMALEITTLSEENEEDDLLESIGNAMHDSGYTTATDDSEDLLQPKMFDGLEKINLAKAVAFVDDTRALTREKARGEGKKFWKRFKEKLRIAICKDAALADLINGKGTLKQYLTVGIPLVAAALGIGVINPVLLAIIAATFALILKVGFAAYCEGVPA